jgi:hypothetical protein
LALSGRHVCWTVWLVAALGLGAALMPPVASLGREDETYYGAIVWTLRRGGVLYRDAWDNKGPVLHYLLAVAAACTRGGPRTYTATALGLLLVAQLAVAYALVQAGQAGAAPAAAALLASAAVIAMARMLSAELVCMALLAVGWAAAVLDRPELAGGAWGLALLSKLSVAPQVAANYLAWLALERASAHRRRLARTAGRAAAGLLLACVLPVAWLIHQGAGPDMVRLLIKYNTAHVLATPWADAWPEFLACGVPLLLRMAAVTVVPLAALPLLYAHLSAAHWPNPLSRGLVLSTAWLGAGLLTYPLLRHFRPPFAYYALPMVPPGAVLTAAAGSVLRARQRHLAAASFALLVAALALLGVSHRARVAAGAWRQLCTGQDLRRWASSDEVKVGLYLRRRTPAAARIWCGPQATGCHFWAQRPAGCRVICPDYYVGVWPGRKDRRVPPPIAAVFADAWQVVQGDLLAKRPAYLVLTRGQLPPPEAAATERLRRWLAGRWRLEVVLGRFELWRLQAGPALPDLHPKPLPQCP